MNQATKDIVVDLWPLYVSGEASADTRALVEGFLKQNPELEARLRDASPELRPAAVTLPVDHERATLLKTQRRRARQSMIVNSLALLASAALTVFYAWSIVPRLAQTFAALGQPLPAGIQIAANGSMWVVRLGIPLVLLGLPLALLFRKRLSLPRFLASGIGLATLTGVALVLAQLCWLVLLNDVSGALVEAHRALVAGKP